MDECQKLIRHCKRYGSKELNLSNQQVTTIPPEVFKLNNIEHLIMQNNKIKEIPSDLQLLVTLKTLDLSQNEIQEVPSFIEDMNQLDFLNLSNNPLLPKFQPLLNAANQANPKLRETLDICFGKAQISV